MATSRHHLWWCQKNYTTPTERKFRNLPCNVVELDFNTHKLIHLHYEPPNKPTHTDMVVAIQRHRNHECGCF